MKEKAILLSVLAAVLIAGIVAVMYVAQTESPVVASVGNGVKIAYAAYDTRYSDEELVWLAQHGDLIIMHESLKDKTGFMRAMNPDIILLLYKFSGMSDETSIGHSASGFGEVYQQHREWFLRDKLGNLVSDDYSEWSREHSFYMDPGNQEWREYSISNYLESAKGWDGIFLDAIPVEINQMTQQGLASYGSPAEYQQVLISYLAYAHSRFKEQDKLLIVNGAALIYQDSPISQWLSFMSVSDGALEESFANRYYWEKPLVWQPEERWLQQVEAMELAGSQGKHYLAFSHNRGLNRQDTVYNLGSFMLGSHENSYFYNMGLEKYRIENFKKDYAQFQDIYELDLGKPVGKKYLQNTLWVRNFEKGMVVVNPGKFASSITLEKKMRSFDSNKYSTKFAVGPKEAVLLIQDSRR